MIFGQDTGALVNLADQSLFRVRQYQNIIDHLCLEEGDQAFPQGADIVRPMGGQWNGVWMLFQ